MPLHKGVLPHAANYTPDIVRRVIKPCGCRPLTTHNADASGFLERVLRNARYGLSCRDYCGFHAYYLSHFCLLDDELAET